MTATASPARSVFRCRAWNCASPIRRLARHWRRARSAASRYAGPNVFPGYWRMPDKTAAEFRADGFFITGDVGKIDERGYVHIVGRAKDLIITGGFNVYPVEIEAEIDALPGVVESAVIGCPHPDFGEGVTAVVVPQAGRQARREGDHCASWKAGSPSSSCPNACCLWMTFRATPWARCRRTCCASRTNRCTASLRSVRAGGSYSRRANSAAPPRVFQSLLQRPNLAHYSRGLVS